MRKPFTSLLLLCAAVAAQPTPERHVNRNVLSSDRDPKLTITLPSNVEYAGADRFVLYNVADCEIHAFVQPDAHQNTQRLYWIQFEGYLPSLPDAHYTYDSLHQISLGRLDFYADVWVADMAKTRSGSDLEHIESLVRGKGYNLPSQMIFVRLVHLLDQSKRRELMLIYAENAASLSKAELQRDKGQETWAAWKDEVIKRATNSVHIAP